MEINSSKRMGNVLLLIVSQENKIYLDHKENLQSDIYIYSDMKSLYQSINIYFSNILEWLFGQQRKYFALKRITCLIKLVKTSDDLGLDDIFIHSDNDFRFILWLVVISIIRLIFCKIIDNFFSFFVYMVKIVS